MNRSTRFPKTLFAGAAVLLCSAPVHAVVIEPGSSVASSPSDAVMARWGNNASGVVISSEHILTTRHQGLGIGTTVNVDGTNYTVAEITVVQDLDTPTNNLDLRVARLEAAGGLNPNFTESVGIYTGTDEVGKALVIGGYGEGRGTAITGGFDWDNTQGTLRFGGNVATGTLDDLVLSGGPTTYTNDAITAIFTEPGTGDAVVGEASIAEGDSGGGWFYFDGSDWQLVALSQAVDNFDEALYGEELYGVRLSSYATQINSIVPEPASLTILAVGGLLLTRRRR